MSLDQRLAKQEELAASGDASSIYNGLIMSRSLMQSAMRLAFGILLWTGIQQPASAQVLLAQSGTAKTAVGWVIVLLCIGLGLLVVCRPSARKVTNFKLVKK